MLYIAIVAVVCYCLIASSVAVLLLIRREQLKARHEYYPDEETIALVAIFWAPTFLFMFFVRFAKLVARFHKLIAHHVYARYFAKSKHRAI